MKNSADLGGCYPASVYTVKFRKPFLRGLYSAGGGGEGGLSTEGNSVSKFIGLALYLEGNLPCLLCFTLYLSAISKYKPPGGGLIFGGAVSIKHGLQTADWV